MRISELVEQLINIKEQKGDLPVVYVDAGLEEHEIEVVSNDVHVAII